jgi:uncharacterized coiled-coil protein SlyX
MEAEQILARLASIEERLDFVAQSLKTLNASVGQVLEALAKKK